jgi:hypothetical protein
MTEGIPATAAGWVEHCVDLGQKAYEEIWKETGLPEPVEHMRYVTLMIGNVIEATLWEALRLADPAAADLLAADVADLCDAGDSFGELLYEWRERLAAGLPISGATYQDAWQRAGLTRG